MTITREVSATGSFDSIFRVLERQVGIRATRSHASAIARRVQERADQLGRTLDDYEELLRSDASERDWLIESATINETFFFRHPDQFKTLRAHLLPGLVAKSRATGTPIRIWSAACSNGCEPYSIAITLLEAETALGNFPWKIIGTDIDSTALEAAERGIFTDREVTQVLPPELLNRYFEPAGPGRWRIGEKLQQRLGDEIRFARQNLLTEKPFERCDVIFCRNVLYYINRADQDAILAKFALILQPDGYLFLGATETTDLPSGFFEFTQPSLRIARAWSTLDASSPLAESDLPDRCRISMPLIPITEAELIGIQGRISNRTALASVLEHVKSASRTTQSLSLDLRGLEFISNDALQYLGEVLKNMRRNGKIFEAIYCAEVGVRNWFFRAQFHRCFPRIILVKPGVTEAKHTPLPGTSSRPVERAQSGTVEMEGAWGPERLMELQMRISPAICVACRAVEKHEVAFDFAQCTYLSPDAARLIQRSIQAIDPAIRRVILRNTSASVERLLKPHLPSTGLVTWEAKASI